MEGALLVSEGATVSEKIFGGTQNFLDLVKQVGSTCVDNEICVLFLTATFVGLGVRMLRKVIGAFGRGR